MIWLNLKALERRLATNQLTAENTLGYLLTFLIFFTTLFYLPRDSSFPFTGWDLAELLLVLLITIIAVKKIFSINKTGGNTAFYERFLSLSFVTGFRLFIIVMLLWLAYKIIMFIIPLDMYVFINQIVTHETIVLLFTPIVVLVFYYLMIRSFTRINSTNYIPAKA